MRKLLGYLWVPVKQFLARYFLLIEFCRDCGREQPLVWHAPDLLWARYSGHLDGSGILCPECFTARAARYGVLLTWTCTDNR